MQGRLTQHEVRARLADLRTVEEQADVVLRGVFATHAQAVVDGLQADVVARRAPVDAVVHRRGHLVVHVLFHWDLLIAACGLRLDPFAEPRSVAISRVYEGATDRFRLRYRHL